MNIEKMREEFQKWKGYPLPEINSDGQYDKEYLQREWLAWQASRAAIEVELPSNVSGFDPSVCSMIDAIESIGLKAKTS